MKIFTPTVWTILRKVHNSRTRYFLISVLGKKLSINSGISSCSKFNDGYLFVSYTDNRYMCTNLAFDANGALTIDILDMVDTQDIFTEGVISIMPHQENWEALINSSANSAFDNSFTQTNFGDFK
jgi:hypothetical protein